MDPQLPAQSCIVSIFQGEGLPFSSPPQAQSAGVDCAEPGDSRTALFLAQGQVGPRGLCHSLGPPLFGSVCFKAALGLLGVPLAVRAARMRGCVGRAECAAPSCASQGFPKRLLNCSPRDRLVSIRSLLNTGFR